MRLSLIVAMSENRVIGRQGTLPWRLPSDLRRFKRLTMGHHLIMGRRTFESIGRCLPGRTSVVLTRRRDYDGRGAVVVHDLQSALRCAGNDSEAFVIGGAEIYLATLPVVDRVYLTLVHAVLEGDVFFPPCDPDAWTVVRRERIAADDRNQYDHSFLVMDRVAPKAQ